MLDSLLVAASCGNQFDWPEVFAVVGVAAAIAYWLRLR
jgi:hypothetical protein